MADIRNFPRNNINKWLSCYENKITFQYYFDYLCLLAMSRFTYENLPLTVNKRFMELMLLTKGSVAFFHDDLIGLSCLPYNNYGELNIFGEPTSIMTYGANGRFYKKKSTFDSQIIWDNPLHTIITEYLQFYAYKLADIDRTIQINMKVQKTPILIVCNENQRMTMLNMYKEFDGNEPLIKGTKNVGFEDFKILKTDAPYIADKMLVDKQKIWNEICTFLGINNANTEKRERMISDEVNSNTQQVELSLSFCLMERKESFDRINKKFGTNIIINKNECLEMNQDGDFEGVENG